MHDVVVTGIGATTPLGGDMPTTWTAMLAGESGVRALDDLPDDLPVRLAAPLRVEPGTALDRVTARRMDRCEQIAMVSAREAWADAGRPEVEPERLAVVIGTGVGGVLTMLEQDDVLERSGPRRVSPHAVTMLMPNGPAAWVSLDLGARGGARTPVSACASGAEAIAMGLDLIRLGRADVVVAGGAEACLHPLPLAAFAQARTLSRRHDDPAAASRPFDVGRDGLVLGEGAAVLVLERADFARARSARPHGVLAGAGLTSNAYDIVASEPTDQARAMRLALESAGLEPQDVDHVHAHATSTPHGDPIEAEAIADAVGARPVVTATKSMTGHLLGASGALGAISALLALRDGIVPATRNLDELDPRVRLDVVRGEGRRGDWKAALANSFGFGGHNVCLAFTRA
ncbi:beta-ketoacyl-[acyl-carrier-protein] synthase family protein [Streptoalloteichus hindustanus]|uniref:3-oxoacyl-[acyl-carrier-protein] synthase II n=1 Tax=Streptoalloteichus hindustanus TaxID=2017 RepID=A0A1M4VLY4_STRHI|nr:beta-ketoacyl-[acyl-carrier-protein] synthase family protein [Streptoalloteichus hindustanus]SHE69790.1 3-oxoacyl-[acyl-carrier-protein] synthase II [Streptoalloteichus hindustanus]